MVSCENAGRCDILISYIKHWTRGELPLHYEENMSVAVTALCDLREAVGWNRLDELFENPNRTVAYNVACYDGTHLVGYVEAVSNRTTDAYIQDCMVHPAYQHKGIGTALIERMIGILKREQIYMISVIYGEAALRPFYEKFGFFTMLCGTIENASCI